MTRAPKPAGEVEAAVRKVFEDGDSNSMEF
jgi:hypothetical protein